MYNTNAQDMFASDYRLYIEGIQVPFESVQITNAYQALPQATISLPPWPGLQELGRNYAPKVQVFWRDYNYGVDRGLASQVSDASTLREMQRDAYKLIYSGVITGTSDAKQVGTDSANQSISLQCMHPIECLKDLLIRYGNQHITAAQAQLDVPSEGSLQSAEWDVNTLMIKALMGIQQGKAEGDIAYVPPEKWDELKGTPGMLYVMWNAIKRDANRNMGTGNNAEILTDIFIPLIEDGLKFWERMTGHASIEEGIATKKFAYTSDDAPNGVDPDLSGTVQVPGAFRSFIGEAAQKVVSLNAMQGLMSGLGSPESYSFWDTIQALLERMEYELTTLSAPVSLSDGRQYEFIVKPQLPNYYAPICNVVLPNMLDSINVSNNYDQMPSRTVNLSNIISLVNGASTGGAPSQSYTSPHSVRYARSGGSGKTLGDSLNAYNNNAGKYEYGSGVRASTTQLPQMYNVLKSYLDDEEKKVGVDEANLDAPDHTKAETAWNNMYPEDKWPGRSSYNPLSLGSGISGFNRLNFLYADYQFAHEISKARTAGASGVFNPYAVVGYPMDFVDATPSRESYHGLCVQVNHTIHASGSSSTNYGLASVSSFSELALYNLPAVNPYLTSVFDLDSDFRIYKNATAYAKACKVYTEVFGVGAAEPALLQDYETGTTIPFTRDTSSGSWTTTPSSTAGDSATSSKGFLETVQGSLMLVARNLVSLPELEKERVADGLSPFVDIADWSDAQSEEISYVPNVTRVEIVAGEAKILTPGIDAESSPFLDYP